MIYEPWFKDPSEGFLKEDMNIICVYDKQRDFNYVTLINNDYKIINLVPE